MIKELIVLADELDKNNEKKAADFVDKLIKKALGDEAPLPELIPEADIPNIDLDDEFDDEFDGEPTKVEFASKTGLELVSRLKNFFMQNPDPMLWSDEDRAKVLEAMEILKG